jgi:hypothetical protein
MRDSQHYILFRGRKIGRRVTLVVRVTDRFTGGQPFGDVEVYIKDSRITPIKNLSNFYVYTQLPAGDFTIKVETQYYIDDEIMLTPDGVAQLDPKDPVIDVKLVPLPSYPFPSNATLIRGMVLDKNNDAVPGAAVEIAGKEGETLTTHRGEFVLYFNALTEDDIKMDGNKKVVTVGGKRKINLKVRHGNLKGSTTLTDVPEGKTTSLPSPIKLGG